MEKWLELFEDDFRHVYLCKDTDKFRENKHREKGKRNIVFTRFNLSFFYHFATAKYIIREAGFNSVGLWPSKKSIVVQLWHGAGAFKKFGFYTKWNKWRKFWREKDIKNWDVVFCSSDSVVNIYSKAFGGFDKKKIVVNGLPRNDILFELNKKRDDLRKNFKINKEKIILFAPTFRDKVPWEHYINIAKDINFLATSISSEFKIALRLHQSIPKFILTYIDFSRILDLNAVKTEEALVISDILITDYSSIIFDFALLERPILFYAPDLNDYYDRRGFYFDYKSFVPGHISYTKEELLESIKKFDYTKWKTKIIEFKSKFNPYFDGKNSERAIKKILEIG